jgi:hypothetical protein
VTGNGSAKADQELGRAINPFVFNELEREEGACGVSQAICGTGRILVLAAGS